MSGYNASQVAEIFKPKLSGWTLGTRYEIQGDILVLTAVSPDGKRVSVELLPTDLMLPAEELIAKFLPVLKGERDQEKPPEPEKPQRQPARADEPKKHK